MRNQSGLKFAHRFFFTQIFVAILLMVLFGIFNLHYILSAFLGCIVNIVPNYLFARKLFLEQRVLMSKQIVLSFYQGEAYKLIFSAMMFALVFICFNVVPWVFFTVYILMQLMIWLALLNKNV